MSTEQQAPAAPGRRVRGKEDKQQRILQAATDLFAERGFSAVTTHSVSDRADVADGTLFRYASSKSELLLMVYNEEFRAALEEGRARAADESDPVTAAYLLAATIVRIAGEQDENAIAYQRELLYGSPTETYRQQGLALVTEMEQTLAARLADAARDRGHTEPGLERSAALAGRTIFAATSFIVSRRTTGAHPESNPEDDLRAQIAQVVAGFFAGLDTEKFGNQKEETR
jgi:AcrR family transcriptional regulator